MASPLIARRRSLGRLTLPLVVAALVALGPAACRAFRHAPSPDPTRLTQAELAPYAGRSLLDAIRTLRPRWLERTYTVPQRPGVTTITVYIDNQRAGSAAYLESMTAGSVVALRYYTPSEAQGRWGPGNLNGVIHVTTLDSIEP